MKIIRMRADSFKRLQAVEIEPNGEVVIVRGENEQGKSSLLDAIFAALAGKRNAPAVPVRRGEQRATIEIELGNGDVAELMVTRRFHADGKTDVKVEAANGARFPSPQTMLDELLGAISFDPLAFTRMKPRDQFDLLLSMTDLDIDPAALDAETERDTMTRRDLNRDIKALRAQADAIDVPDDLPAEAADIDALVARMGDAANHNARVQADAKQRADLSAEAEALDRRADELRMEAMRCEDRAAAARRELASLPPVDDPVDTDALRAQIAETRAAAAGHEAAARRQQLDRQIAEKEAQSDGLTAAMEARAKVKADALAKAKLPFDRLSLGDGEVLLDDLPIAQAASSHQLRASTAIAMAANPKLRVLRIADGSLLGKDSMAAIAEMAREQGFQIWIECVGDDGVGIIMEDGSVREIVEQEAA